MDGIVSGEVRIVNGSFDVDVIVTLTVNIKLHLVVHLVGIVFVVELRLHNLNVLIHQAHLVDKLAAISVHAIELLEHQIQTLLQRTVVLLQLAQIFVTGSPDGANCHSLLRTGEKAVASISGVNIASRASTLLSERARWTFLTHHVVVDRRRNHGWS